MPFSLVNESFDRVSGIGKQLVVYDTSKPSGPIKTIAMNENCIGDINAVVCSPFSKTLVACCTSGGNVGLIDLDKEKGYLFSFQCGCYSPVQGCSVL